MQREVRVLQRQSCGVPSGVRATGVGVVLAAGRMLSVVVSQRLADAAAVVAAAQAVVEFDAAAFGPAAECAAHTVNQALAESDSTMMPLSRRSQLGLELGLSAAASVVMPEVGRFVAPRVV